MRKISLVVEIPEKTYEAIQRLTQLLKQDLAFFVAQEIEQSTEAWYDVLSLKEILE